MWQDRLDTENDNNRESHKLEDFMDLCGDLESAAEKAWFTKDFVSRQVQFHVVQYRLSLIQPRLDTLIDELGMK